MRRSRVATMTTVAVAAVLLSAVTAPATAQPVAAPSSVHRADAGVDDAEPAEGHAEMGMSDAETAELGHDREGGEHTSSTGAEEHADEGAHDEGASHEEGGASVPRPRAALLGAFVAVNGAVLLVAAALRRRDRDKPRHRPRAAAGAAPTLTTA